MKEFFEVSQAGVVLTSGRRLFELYGSLNVKFVIRRTANMNVEKKLFTTIKKDLHFKIPIFFMQKLFKKSRLKKKVFAFKITSNKKTHGYNSKLVGFGLIRVLQMVDL